ncbi:MAG: esterase [Candidatus Eremiobacteraeota bacterium]|nr:esterase [Candidatus Eremiobacteraeota bacterium]
MVAVWLATAFPCLARPAWVYLNVDGERRRYFVVEPKSPEPGRALPLVVVFHGGGGSARGTALQGFSRLADRGYLVVFPDGFEHHWSDGRSPAKDLGMSRAVDDLAFVRALLDRVARDYPVDPGRVYATGPSNGGIMSHRVGIELSERFAAIAPIIGGLTEPMARDFAPTRPVSVLIFQSTSDPWVPYQGGAISVGKVKAVPIVSTQRAIELWRDHNGCSPQPVIEQLTDRADDGCTVEKSVYSGGRAEVVFYRIDGGGHTVPGGTQYLPEKVIGKVCRDIDAIDIIADFFDAHHR